LRQPKLPFSRCGVPELTLADVARDLGSGHGSNSRVNFTEFRLKYRSALMQSFYDVHESLQLNFTNYDMVGRAEWIGRCVGSIVIYLRKYTSTPIAPLSGITDRAICISLLSVVIGGGRCLERLGRAISL
jgi:hypothetical protein